MTKLGETVNVEIEVRNQVWESLRLKRYQKKYAMRRKQGDKRNADGKNIF